jgi:hypothetical protein
MVESLDSHGKPVRAGAGGGLGLNGVRRAFSPTVVGGVAMKRLCGGEGVGEEKLSQYFQQHLDSYGGSTEADSLTLGTKRLMGRNLPRLNSMSIDVNSDREVGSEFFTPKG